MTVDQYDPREMGTPVVSVVMPAFNCERYVMESVSSIFKQTLLDFELIVVDDCSTDGTLGLLEGLRDPRVRLLGAPSHQGQTACINQGLSVARGEYVARQDADDISMPERLERQVRYLRDHGDTAMVGSSGWLIDVGDQTPHPIRVRTNPLAVKWGLLFGTAAINLMWRRQYILRNLGQYTEDMRYAEDYDFVARVASIAAVANLPDRLMIYRRHSGAIGVAHKASEQAAAELVSRRQIRDLMGTEPPVPIAWLRAVGLASPDSVPPRELPRALAAFGAVYERFASNAAEYGATTRADLLAVRRDAGGSVGVAVSSAFRRGVGTETLARALGWRASAVVDMAREASCVWGRRLRRQACLVSGHRVTRRTRRRGAGGDHD